jgi:hypothetical protein
LIGSTYVVNRGPDGSLRYRFIGLYDNAFSLSVFAVHLTANIYRRGGLDPVQHATHRLPPARTKIAS